MAESPSTWTSLFRLATAPFLLAIVCLGLFSCKDTDKSPDRKAAAPDGALVRVGSIVITEDDLAWRLQEHHDGREDGQTRQAALAELVTRAQHTQAALDAGLADDPIVRDETSRLLAARLRETVVEPQWSGVTISPERLQALYEEQADRFQAPEKRQVAVLWLDPGNDPARADNYRERLVAAKTFVAQSKDLSDHPEKGFLSLGADYSEHQASRYRGGIIGWLEREGGLDPWTKAVAEIAFALDAKGELSEVITRPEGIFLVRLLDLRPGITRSFDSVVAELERQERARLREEVQNTSEDSFKAAHPPEVLRP